MEDAEARFLQTGTSWSFWVKPFERMKILNAPPFRVTQGAGLVFLTRTPQRVRILEPARDTAT